MGDDKWMRPAVERSAHVLRRAERARSRRARRPRRVSRGAVRRRHATARQQDRADRGARGRSPLILAAVRVRPRPRRRGGWYDIETDRKHLVGVTMPMSDVRSRRRRRAQLRPHHRGARRITARGCLLVRWRRSFDQLPGAESPWPMPRCGARRCARRLLRRARRCALHWCEPAAAARRVAVRAQRDRARDSQRRAFRRSRGCASSGVRWATTLDLTDRGAAAVVPDLLAEGRALYVSIDLDVLDLGIVPGTTLPEPGGLSYRQLRSVLAEVARRGPGRRFRHRRAQPTVRPVGRYGAACHLDHHPLPQRDLRPPRRTDSH